VTTKKPEDIQNAQLNDLADIGWRLIFFECGSECSS
jgi:hypothetical protein